MEDKLPIYYLDECMFTVRTYHPKEFAPVNENITIGAAEFGIKATAFLGVIGQNKAIFHYHLYPRSVNTERYIIFLKSLRKKHGKGPIILYLDNLNVHKSKDSRKAYDELEIYPIWAPIYSPEMNPIEYVFSGLKSKVKKMRL